MSPTYSRELKKLQHFNYDESANEKFRTTSRIFMAHPSNHRVRNGGFLRFLSILVGLILVVYVWRPSPSSSGRSHKPKKKFKALVSCPECSCDCPQSDSFTLPSGIFNVSSSGCTSEDPEMNEELKKDTITLLSEEISLQQNVTRDILDHALELTMDAKQMASFHRREAQKCYVRVDTCETARERAEAALLKESKLTLLWEERARNFGWRD
nr:uncharacterized protein LOC113724584 [Coffea arabica]